MMMMMLVRGRVVKSASGLVASSVYSRCCSAMVGVPHRPLLPSLPAVSSFGGYGLGVSFFGMTLFPREAPAHLVTSPSRETTGYEPFERDNRLRGDSTRHSTIAQIGLPWGWGPVRRVLAETYVTPYNACTGFCIIYAILRSISPSIRSALLKVFYPEIRTS